MNDGSESASVSHGTLRWAIRTSCVAGFVGLAATHYFARADRAEPTRMARSGFRDPETTGSIGPGARALRLDPCVLRSDVRGPRP